MTLGHMPNQGDNKAMGSSSRDLTLRRTPEEIELAIKQAELAGLEAELVERELDLATLQAELMAFERRYYHMVGSRMARLDAIEAEIAKALARANPADASARVRAEEARRQAEASARADPGNAEASPKARFEASPELRKLYRDLAKMVHPDLTGDEDERRERTALMGQINEAYARGDMEALERVAQQWAQRPEAVPGDDIGAELVRTLRRIALVRERLDQAAQEIAALQEADLCQLMQRVQEGDGCGADLLARMAAALDRQIDAATERLATVRREGGCR